MYFLMNKNEKVAEFDFGMAFGHKIAVSVSVHGKLPFDCTEKTLTSWLKGRYAAKHRSHLAGYLNSMSADDVQGFIDLTHSVSINDTYWVKKDTEFLCWEDVSLFDNEFDEVIQHLAFDGGGLQGVQLSSTSPEFGTAGAYEKCWKRESDGIYLYKRGTEGFSNAGLEPYSEACASYVFSTLNAGIKYNLVNYRGKVASKCLLFNTEKEGFVPYAAVYGTDGELQNMLQNYNGFEDSLYYMLVCDAIVFNTDRHLYNFGFIFDTDTLEILRPAPCFDYNLALFPMEVNDAFADVNLFINKYTPKLGEDFIETAKSILTSKIRSDLINLKGFKYPDISDEKFTRDRIDWLSSLSNQQIDKILGISATKLYTSPNVNGISNIYKYKLRNHMTEEMFIQDVPRLMKLFGISHMSELEERIADLL